jgi:uncharacterized RDD family membrane protein YckC
MQNPTEIDDGRLRVDSITGVPLELAIAGPGGRSFAFIIDFHIRLLGALAWFLGFSVVLNSMAAGSDAPPSWLILLSGIPPLAIYFLYHPILEIAMAGRTPGKRMAGIRIVTLDGMVPGIGAIVVRNLFRLVDGLPILYVVGLSCTVATWRHQRVGDFAAGTLLIYDDAGKSESLSSLPRAGTTHGISAIDAELVQDLIDRWRTLDPANRLKLARRLLGRLDPASAQSQESWLNDGNALGALQNRLGALR